MPDAASLHLTTGMTLEAWVKPSALASWRTVILKEAAGGLAYSLYASDNASRPEGYVHVTVDTAASGTSALTLNAWTHVAVSYDGATLTALRQRRAGGRSGGDRSDRGLDRRAAHRRQRGLGRVLQRTDRRGPHLQPRAVRRRDSDGHGDADPVGACCVRKAD